MANLLNERLHNEEEAESKKELIRKKKAEEKAKKKETKKSEKAKKVVIAPKKAEEIKAEETPEIFEEKLESLTGEDYVAEQKALNRSKRRFYTFKIFLCFLCGYLLFLIYGVLVTNYDYDDDGVVRAQIMTREDIKNQKEFTTLLGYYIDARNLYEKVLVINYRYDKGIEDPLDLVPEYESHLDECNRILVQLRAFSPQKAYTPAYNMLVAWINSDIASYLQEISAGLSQSNTERMQNAINDKQRTYTDFYMVTANMISLGENIKGVNISSLKEWSPEEYIKKEMGDV